MNDCPYYPRFTLEDLRNGMSCEYWIEGHRHYKQVLAGQGLLFYGGAPREIGLAQYAIALAMKHAQEAAE